MAKKESKALNKKEKNSKDKKSFVKSFKGELKKVSWPTPKQLVNNTIAVIMIVVVIAVIVFVLDLAFDAVNKYGIDKIKEAVVSTSDETENTEAPENTEIDENAENTEATEETSTDETTEVNE